MESGSLFRKVYFFFLFVLFLLILANFGFNSLKNFLSSFIYRSPHALATIDFAFFSSEIKKSYVSQGYGKTDFSLSNYPSRRHNGIDIVARYGAPIISATGGTVAAAGNQDDFCPRRGYGKFMVIENADDNYAILYAHLGEIKMKVGKKVRKGNVIATVGVSGFETAPHLHFTVFKRASFRMEHKEGCGPNPEGKDINPISYLESLTIAER